jgi:hypothetical protein
MSHSTQHSRRRDSHTQISHALEPGAVAVHVGTATTPTLSRTVYWSEDTKRMEAPWGSNPYFSRCHAQDRQAQRNKQGLLQVTVCSDDSVLHFRSSVTWICITCQKTGIVDDIAAKNPGFAKCIFCARRPSATNVHYIISYQNKRDWIFCV